MDTDIAYVLDEVFAGHQPPRAHPERPERMIAVRDALRLAGLSGRGRQLPLRMARDDELGLVHGPGYLDDLTRLVPGRSGWLDADTYYSPGTWEAAIAAAAAVVDLATAVLAGQVRRGLALVRPPGHHAEADRAMGFCLLNNVAVAAAAARAQGAARVAILDWDVHHGNGTQHIFYEDPTVLYLSCHQYPYYPGTGAPTELGAGAGRGATINVGLPAGAGNAEYRATFDQVLAPALRRFRPDILLVSAGFDAHVDDPLASMRVTRDGYASLAQTLRQVADEVCEGRVVCALEGGYDLDALADGVVALLDAFDPPGDRSGAARDQPVHGQAAPGATAAEAGQDIMAGARQAIAATLAAHAAVTAGDGASDPD